MESHSSYSYALRMLKYYRTWLASTKSKTFVHGCLQFPAIVVERKLRTLNMTCIEDR